MKFQNSSYSVRKTLWWKIFENHNQISQRIFFFEKTGKKRNAAFTPYSRRLEIAKPLNYTIFKSLGKKSGQRKQLHLWQVSKASQLQYYLVKILQDNAFFTRLKNAKNPVFSTFQSFANFHPVSHWELFISLQHSRTLCLHATPLPQTGLLSRLTNIDAART